jgi:hypothetical protein
MRIARSTSTGGSLLGLGHTLPRSAMCCMQIDEFRSYEDSLF